MRKFKTGDRVIVTTGAGKKKKKRAFIGVFQLMQTRTRAVVFVDPTKADDDGMRLADLRSIAHYYDDPTDRQRRSRHAARLFKQGVRWFRLGGPTGDTFNVLTLVADTGTVFGCKKKRKTIIEAKAHDLWPETYR